MLFSVIISVAIVVMGFLIGTNISSKLYLLEEAFGQKEITDVAVFNNAPEYVLKKTCPKIASSLIELNDQVQTFIMVTTITGIGYLTAVLQDISIIRILNNVKLNLFSMTLQSSIFVVSVLLLIMNLNMPLDTVFTEGCGDYITLT